MLRALELAAKGLGHTRPNPPVGAVVVKSGRIVGEGWHKKAGGDHAEVAAIKNARRSGASTKGATVYVTLEPCSRPGRVGACTDAIVAAGISKVVYAAQDPNPTNRGRARRVLAKAGVECEVLRDRAIVAKAEDIIRPFAKHVTTGLPFVTVKIAMSLDGRICDDWGDAKWISSDSARRFTSGRLRETVDAIMVGAETVRRDDPSLLSHGRRNDDLVRVVVSRSGRLPEKARIFTDGAPNETLVFDDAKKAIGELGRRGITHVLCEGGLKLAVSLAESGLVDEWMTVLAPKVVGTRRIGEATTIGRTTCLQG
jgi:diaminohydroxyphosphoribosylaminopyrimidine deaminase/5-amino-6-(5-phosphoribosylamino)uracil reductase